MTNLFSIFDPIACLGLKINWISAVVTSLLLLSSFWALSNQLSKLFSLIVKSVNHEFKAIMGTLTAPGSTLLVISLFTMIAMNNSCGLIPYVFTAPSHLTFTVALALPLWVGHMLMAWKTVPKNMLAHLVPVGTPPILMPFMVLIELVSSLIRPITLSVRLAANMVAGHLLLTLLSAQSINAPLSVLVCVIMSILLLGILESAVALIQAYVFSVLMTLYLNEIETKELSHIS